MTKNTIKMNMHNSRTWYTKPLKINNKKKPVFLFLSLVFLVGSCIESFTPDIDKYESAMVIIGELIETDFTQKVEVSKSSNYNNKQPQPVSGCTVFVEDDKGNVFNYFETNEGIYTCHIEPQYISIGTSYRLVVNTNTGNTYTSEFDKLEECPEIENIYYAIEKKIQGVEQLEMKGVQFYIDAKKNATQTKYCLWSLDETWEYRAYLENNAKLVDGEIIKFETPVFEPLCWMSKKITSIYTAQIENEVKPFKINFVTNTTPRLFQRYSLHVRQFGISEGAYAFWTTLGSQFEGRRNLYQKQPQGLNSNIKNPNNEDEKVIGYFNTASVKETRIFVDRQELDLDIEDYCDIEPFPEDPEEWPPVAYLYMRDESPEILMSTDSACFDCTARGGTKIKPHFWED